MTVTYARMKPMHEADEFANPDVDSLNESSIWAWEIMEASRHIKLPPAFVCLDLYHRGHVQPQLDGHLPLQVTIQQSGGWGIPNIRVGRHDLDWLVSYGTPMAVNTARLLHIMYNFASASLQTAAESLRDDDVSAYLADLQHRSVSNRKTYSLEDPLLRVPHVRWNLVSVRMAWDACITLHERITSLTASLNEPLYAVPDAFRFGVMAAKFFRENDGYNAGPIVWQRNELTRITLLAGENI